MLNNEKMIDREEYLINELREDTVEEAKIYLEVAIEEYEKDEELEYLVFSFERYVKARGLADLINTLAIIGYNPNMGPLVPIYKDKNTSFQTFQNA